MMKRITVLGSTGSIGVSTLDVVSRRRDEFSIFALVAGHNAELLARQIIEFRPRMAALEDEAGRAELMRRLEDAGLPRNEWPQIETGPAARVSCAVAPEADIVLSAIVGVAGLEATYEATCRGKRIALANKETLVASGKLVLDAARRHRAELLPVDSEHNGAHQCFRAGRRDEVARLILTASGGPFRETPRERLHSVTPEQALNHPTWRMGQRITIDSATLMNKGFEVIEACWLFGLEPDQVEVVVHPQSSIHAMVEYTDGSVIAQISATDMRMPIQYALTWPARQEAPVPRLDWSELRSWTFFPPDFQKFPLLQLAYEAQREGGSATCTLNAADEVAVSAFLNEHISFPQIGDVVRETLERMPSRQPASIVEVMETDRRSREIAQQVVTGMAERRHTTAPAVRT
ncbi:MAG TPA: 1-deoxy-D-xylulose-5-phosphate reductoisomerase [Bryobacteraceae bacterium]|nr:1-deoxy-D-xylulose-5-phosphate reductoisomerase [Bryobacteraceae bacterium]